jgi:hypothetical protein
MIKHFITLNSFAWFQVSAAIPLGLLTLHDMPRICPETSIRNCHSTPRNNPEERSLISSSTSCPLKMWPICCPVTSARNCHSRLRKIPEERRSKIVLFLEALFLWTRLFIYLNISFYLFYFAVSSVTSCNNILFCRATEGIAMMHNITTALYLSHNLTRTYSTRTIYSEWCRRWISGREIRPFFSLLIYTSVKLPETW